MVEPRYRIRVSSPRCQPSWVALTAIRRGVHVTGVREQAYVASRATIEATVNAVKTTFESRGLTVEIEEVP